MRRSAWVLVLCGCGGGAAAPATPADDGTLRLTWKPPRIGEIAEKTKQTTTEMEFLAQGAPIPVRVEAEERTVTEVLAVDGEAATRVRYAVELSRSTQMMNGSQDSNEDVLHGKTFLVWAEAGTIQATRDDGAPASAEELAELEDDFDDELGVVPPTAAILTGRAWAPGETYTLTADELDRLGAPRRGRTVTQATISFIDEVPGTATFLMEAQLEEKRPEGSFAISYEGTTSIDIEHVRPTSSSSRGTMSGTVSGMRMTGKVSERSQTSYR
jgi:hypothetical protein